MGEEANSDPRLAETGIALRGQAGRLLADPHCLESDLRLIRRAITNGWNIDPAKKARLIDCMMKIIDNDDAEYKDAISAARTIVAADGKDQDFQISQEKSQDPAASTNVNVQVNVGAQPTPITESERVAEAMAILDRARERSVSAPVETANDEVRSARADDAPSGVSKAGVP